MPSLLNKNMYRQIRFTITLLAVWCVGSGNRESKPEFSVANQLSNLEHEKLASSAV